MTNTTPPARIVHPGDTEESCRFCHYFSGHTSWCPAAAASEVPCRICGGPTIPPTPGRPEEMGHYCEKCGTTTEAPRPAFYGKPIDTPAGHRWAGPKAPELLSPAEAAARLGVSVRTLSRYVADGRLPEPRRTAGGHRRFSADDLQRIV
jgi:excisionase family DNA binding protein